MRFQKMVLTGYITWGPIDIPSSSCQVAKRYGFVYVNRTDEELLDLRRVPKKSFYWISKAFKSNGEDLDQYLKASFVRLFFFLNSAQHFPNFLRIP